MLARDGEALFSQDPWGVVSKATDSENNSGSERLFFANLESPLLKTGENPEGKTSGYDLCADEDQTTILKVAGIDLVSIANNHQGDCGDPSGESTQKILEGQSIRSVGSNLSPVYIETSAGRVGVIAAEDVSHVVGADELVRQIKAARSQCDYLIVSMHWGNEYQAGASERQHELAQAIADAGADVLWGHHPHVLQSVEWVDSSISGKKMLVMYSLGNLLSDQWMSQDTQRSALITLNFSEGRIVSISMQPIRMDRATKTLITPDPNEIELTQTRLGLNALTGIEVIPLANGD